MVDDLRVMQVELLPNAKDDDASIVPDRNMDEFQKKKLELNLLLSELNKEVQRLNELRAAAPETRDQATIRLYSENSKNLQQAGVLWKVMKDILIKDESRKRLDEKLLADRKKMMTILAKEIQELSNKNAHVKGLKQSETANTLKTRQEDRARKRREEKQKREERRKREKEKGVEMEGTDKKKKRGSSTEEPEIDIDDGEAREMKASSEQEQQFFNEVEEAKKEQDVMLEEIMSGMNELHSIATEMNQTIKNNNSNGRRTRSINGCHNTKFQICKQTITRNP